MCMGHVRMNRCLHYMEFRGMLGKRNELVVLNLQIATPWGLDAHRGCISDIYIIIYNRS